MANAVVTSDAVRVKTVFNDMEPITGFSIGYYRRASITSVRANVEKEIVEIFLNDGSTYAISLTGALGTLIVDTIDGVAPTDITDMAEKIAALQV